MNIASLSIVLILLETCSSLPTNSNSNQYDFVLSAPNQNNSSARDGHSRTKRHSPRLTVTRYHVSSNVTFRWNTVAVESTIRNDDHGGQEIAIEVVIPEEAFISAFSMEIGGVIHKGVVKTRGTARCYYDYSQQQEISAGLVSAGTSVRDSQIFKLKVNVAGQSTVSYKLVYQELLRRKNGYYNLVIHALPKQFVTDYKVVVLISEPLQFKNNTIEVTLPDNSHAHADLKIESSGSQARATYRPTQGQQQTSNAGTFKVSYDVDHGEFGDLIEIDGYFVFYYVPDNWPTIAKKIVFIIDRSGSMRGIKSEQTKMAMKAILDDLQPKDRFSIICFDSTVSHIFGGSSVQLHAVTDSTIADAKTFVDKALASPSGGTNMLTALERGIHVLETTSDNAAANAETASMIVLLTDGHPNGGPRRIISAAKSRINRLHSLFCIGFGNDVDHTFLKTLAEENNGASRKIYQASDGAIQLKNFYDEIALPALAHVYFERMCGVPDFVFKRPPGSMLNKGQDLVAAGRCPVHSGPPGTGGPPTTIRFTGKSTTGTIRITAEAKPFPQGFKIDNNFDLERLWAYLTIKSLLPQVPYAEASAKALEMALDYKFVTDVTSMVVTDPTNKQSEMEHCQQNVRRFRNNGKDFSGLRLAGHMAGGTTTPPDRSSWTINAPPPSILPITDRVFVAATVAPVNDSATLTAVSDVMQHVTADKTFILDSNQKSKTISTPPGAYPPNATIAWKFQLRDGIKKYSYLQFKLDRLDMETEPHCARDRINIYGDLENGGYASARLVCGFHPDQAYIEANMVYGWKNIYVLFKSNGFISGNGFSAKVEVKIPLFCWRGRCYYG